MLQRIILLLIVLALPGYAQTFNSGSTGDDGPLSFPANAGTIVFDPATLTPPLPADHGPIYNFTTITIPTGTTVKLTHRAFRAPVVWLAQGAVDIAGVLDLNGDAGAAANALGLRNAAAPGPGGFFGGVGGNSASQTAASSGFGPAPGTAGIPTTQDPIFGGGGGFTANAFLVPLLGGSGGGGGSTFPGVIGQVGGSGGGGGGAILIASCVSIRVIGQIQALGGLGGGFGVLGNVIGAGGGGAGGAIRLMAPRIEGAGTLNAVGGSGVSSGRYTGQNGRVRLEAFQHLETFNLPAGPPITSTPFDTFVTTNVPSIRVLTVAGAAVNPNPTGTFDVPDVAFNNPAAVPVVIEARNVSLTATVALQVFSENGPDLSVPVPTLTGNETLSTATVNVTFPTGFSRGFLRASFTTTPTP